MNHSVMIWAKRNQVFLLMSASFAFWGYVMNLKSGGKPANFAFIPISFCNTISQYIILFIAFLFPQPPCSRFIPAFWGAKSYSSLDSSRGNMELNPAYSAYLLNPFILRVIFAVSFFAKHVPAFSRAKRSTSQIRRNLFLFSAPNASQEGWWLLARVIMPTDEFIWNASSNIDFLAASAHA